MKCKPCVALSQECACIHLVIEKIYKMILDFILMFG